MALTYPGYDNSRPSPNFWTAQHAADQGIRYDPWGVVIHSTEGSYPTDVEYLCRADIPNRVSAHVYIRRDGTRYLLVPWECIAWHCWTRPEWRIPRYTRLLAAYEQHDGDQNGNFHWLGIELEALRGADHPDVQLDALCRTLIEMAARYPRIRLDREHLFGHYELNTHKVDPQPWDWAAFLERLGKTMAEAKVPPVVTPTSLHFAEYGGHEVSGTVLDLWQRLGGLPVCGLPLSGLEPNPEDPTEQVQFFENVMIRVKDAPGFPRLGAGVRLYFKAVHRL